MELREKEIRVERICRSGPGGQHRNRRATGIRLTHIPTGIIVMATEERSQKQNLETARDRLLAKLKRRARRKKPRVKTKPGRAAKEKRLKAKKKRGETKTLRKRVTNSD